MVGLVPIGVGSLLFAVALWFVPLPGNRRGLAPASGSVGVALDVLAILAGAGIGLVVGFVAPVFLLGLLGHEQVSYEDVLLTVLVALCAGLVGGGMFALRVRRALVIRATRR